ncbi:MAG: GIY-YIG nuclease family protein [Acidobacteriota bacterium]
MAGSERQSIDRKAAIRAYKERSTARGVFALRCLASGQAWVGASTNLRAAENALRFTLRLGTHREATMQQAWNAHGEAAFQYDVLETLDDDTSPLLVRDLLKKKRADCAARVRAVAVLL